MVVLLVVTLDDAICIPYLLSLQFYKLIHNRLHDSYSHFIILGFIVMVNYHEILMDCEQNLFHIKLIDELFEDFAQLK